MNYIKVLDAVTGTSSSAQIKVEGDYLLLLDGGTIGTVELQASNTDDGSETYVALDEASFTANTGKNITLPPCWIKAVYTASTTVTLRLIPFRRD
jgi:hypothetical protein